MSIEHVWLVMAAVLAVIALGFAVCPNPAQGRNRLAWAAVELARYGIVLMVGKIMWELVRAAMGGAA